MSAVIPRPAPQWLRDVLAKDKGRDDPAEVQRERQRRQAMVRRRSDVHQGNR